ncbi:uncharacterized protein LOC144116559 [Amblyomma americanum]
MTLPTESWVCACFGGAPPPTSTLTGPLRGGWSRHSKHSSTLYRELVRGSQRHQSKHGERRLDAAYWNHTTPQSHRTNRWKVAASPPAPLPGAEHSDPPELRDLLAAAMVAP